MKEYGLIFRMDITTKDAQPSVEQMQEYMNSWNEWVKTITDKNQLSEGNHFSREGRVLKKNNQTDKKPYIADKMSVAGYLIIKAKDLDAAVQIAKKCPILDGENTSVEVRQVESIS